MDNDPSLRAEAQRRVSEGIRRAMSDSGVSQVELARRSGVSQPRISSILSGERGKFSLELLRVLDALGMSLAVVPRKTGMRARQVGRGADE